MPLDLNVIGYQIQSLRKSKGYTQNLLGRENLFYRSAIEGIDTKMNIELELYLSQPQTYEAMVAEAAIQCIMTGYYIDTKDIEKGFVSEHWRNMVTEYVRKYAL